MGGGGGTERLFWRLVCQPQNILIPYLTSFPHFTSLFGSNIISRCRVGKFDPPAFGSKARTLSEDAWGSTHLDMVSAYSDICSSNRTAKSHRVSGVSGSDYTDQTSQKPPRILTHKFSPIFRGFFPRLFLPRVALASAGVRDTALFGVLARAFPKGRRAPPYNHKEEGQFAADFEQEDLPPPSVCAGKGGGLGWTRPQACYERAVGPTGAPTSDLDVCQVRQRLLTNPA